MTVPLDRGEPGPLPGVVASVLAAAPPEARPVLVKLWQGRRTLLTVVAISAVLATGISFLLPPVYIASSEVVDSSPTVSGSSLDRMSARLADLGLGSGTPASQMVIYPEILRSRHLLTQLLDTPVHFAKGGPPVPFLDVLMPPGRREARIERGIVKLRRNMDVVFDRKAGIVTVRTSAPDPQVAADLTNRAIALLQEFVLQSRSALARENREYIERRIHETQTDLGRAEEALRSFREANPRISMSPRLQLEEGRLDRAVKVQEEVFVTLNRQRELAAMDEHRDVSVLLVIDPAQPPAFRSAPRRSLIIAFGLGLGLLLGGWMAFEGAGRTRGRAAA